jgi:hypothetical protein
MVAGVTSPGRPVDLSLGVAERGRGGDGSGVGPRQGARVRRRGQIEAQRKSEGLPALRRVRDPAALLERFGDQPNSGARRPEGRATILTVSGLRRLGGR